MTITTMATLIQWDYGSECFSSPTRRDCQVAEWLSRTLLRFENGNAGLWWQTVIDMMLHGY